MQDTRQPEVLTELKKYMVRTVDDKSGQEEFEFTPPEELRRFIDIGLYWWKVKDACGMVDPATLSELELNCLMAATEGINRATNAKQNEPTDNDA